MSSFFSNSMEIFFPHPPSNLKLIYLSIGCSGLGETRLRGRWVNTPAAGTANSLCRVLRNGRGRLGISFQSTLSSCPDNIGIKPVGKHRRFLPRIKFSGWL